MQLPPEPTEVQVKGESKTTKLDANETIKGMPQKITPNGENPMAFTLKDEQGRSLEIKGVLGRDLFDVAYAIERGKSIEVSGSGRLIKQ